MDQQLIDAGMRIRSRMPVDMSQSDLAEKADMKPDALSRALNGHRGFSMLELTRIGHILDTEVHWLITGEPDPHRVDIAARHRWNRTERAHHNPGEIADASTIEQIYQLYRDAYPGEVPPSAPVPESSVEARSQLGTGFVRDFARVVEERWGVDVVRVPGLSTDYSLRVGDRSVIVLTASPTWYRSNFSLAHELGHLALGHHGATCSQGPSEAAANQYAAELLLPESDVREQRWPEATMTDVADFIWSNGVSSQALKLRLTSLDVARSSLIDEALAMSTPTLLRKAIQAGSPFTHATTADRDQQSASRRFPLDLLGSLTERVASGVVSPIGLAWALDVSADDLDFPETDEGESADRYANAIGFSS